MALRLAGNHIPLDAAVVAVLAAIDEADRERLAEILSVLSTASTKASSRLLAFPRAAEQGVPDRNLDVHQAADRLGMSRAYVYRNAKRFPFTVRMGRRLVFSERGLEKFIKQQAGR